MFKKPNIDIEDLEFYINEYVLNGGEPFTLIKKVKVDEILKEEIATRWNPLTRSNQYLGWNLKVKLTFFVTEGAIGRFFYDEIEMFNNNFKGDFIKKYLNYPINEFTYDGHVEELNDENNLTESIKKVLNEFNFVIGIVEQSVTNLVDKYFSYLNDEYLVSTEIYYPKDYTFLPQRKKRLPEKLQELQVFLDDMIENPIIRRVDVELVKKNKTKYLFLKVFLNESIN